MPWTIMPYRPMAQATIAVLSSPMVQLGQSKTEEGSWWCLCWIVWPHLLNTESPHSHHSSLQQHGLQPRPVPSQGPTGQKTTQAAPNVGGNAPPKAAPQGAEEAALPHPPPPIHPPPSHPFSPRLNFFYIHETFLCRVIFILVINQIYKAS